MSEMMDVLILSLAMYFLGLVVGFWLVVLVDWLSKRSKR